MVIKSKLMGRERIISVLAKYGRSFKGVIPEPGGRIYVEFLGVMGRYYGRFWRYIM